MSNKSTPGWLGRIGTIAPIASAVIGLLLLILGGGFIYNNWLNVPDLAYTILPTYKLQDQSFGGLVVENRGRATAHDVSIRLTDLRSNIEQYSVDSDELWTLEDGGTDASHITIWLDRMTAGSSATIYLLTSEPVNLDRVAVRAEEGPGHPALAVSGRESILLVLTTLLAVSGVVVLVYSISERFRQRVEKVRAEIQFISLLYDFIDHFSEAEHVGGPGTVIEPHLPATCGQERKRAIHEHPPSDANEFSKLTYNPTLPRGTRPLKLKGFIGIETELPTPAGPRPSQRGLDNAVQFQIFINDNLEFEKRKQTSEWEEFSIPVRPADRLSISFVTNGLGDNTFNWAVWGEPRLVETAEQRSTVSFPTMR